MPFLHLFILILSVFFSWALKKQKAHVTNLPALFCCFLSFFPSSSYAWRIHDDDCSICLFVIYYKLDIYKIMSLDPIYIRWIQSMWCDTVEVGVVRLLELVKQLHRFSTIFIKANLYRTERGDKELHWRKNDWKSSHGRTHAINSLF